MDKNTIIEVWALWTYRYMSGMNGAMGMGIRGSTARACVRKHLERTGKLPMGRQTVRLDQGDVPGWSVQGDVTFDFPDGIAGPALLKVLQPVDENDKPIMLDVPEPPQPSTEEPPFRARIEAFWAERRQAREQRSK